MNLIAAATLYAFHGSVDHSRYLKLGTGDEPAEGLTIHIDSSEQDIVADALLEARNYQKACGSPYQKTENLLRRVVGSITEYMQLMGEYPAEMTAYGSSLVPFVNRFPRHTRLYRLMTTKAGEDSAFLFGR